MSAEDARAIVPEDALPDEPAPDGYLDRPEVRARVEAALERVRTGRVRRGRTADEILELARERRELGS